MTELEDIKVDLAININISLAQQIKTDKLNISVPFFTDKINIPRVAEFDSQESAIKECQTLLEQIQVLVKNTI
jgi:hypothetical protein